MGERDAHRGFAPSLSLAPSVTQCDGGEDSTCRSFNPLHCHRITESDQFLQLDARTYLDLMLVQSGLKHSSRLANELTNQQSEDRNSAGSQR